MNPLNHSGNAYAAALAAQARTPVDQIVDAKMYFHQHNYAKFHFDLGGSRVKTIQFANYRYITDDKREQDQLDLVADCPGTFIYTIPGSDVAAAMVQELAAEANKSIMQTAQAASAVNNQVFDPNAPIIPVNVQTVTQTPGLTVGIAPNIGKNAQGQGVAVTGLQNSLSGTQPTDGVEGKMTTPQTQTSAPSAADEAIARLNAMNPQQQK